MPLHAWPHLPKLDDAAALTAYWEDHFDGPLPPIVSVDRTVLTRNSYKPFDYLLWSPYDDVGPYDAHLAIPRDTIEIVGATTRDTDWLAKQWADPAVHLLGQIELTPERLRAYRGLLTFGVVPVVVGQSQHVLTSRCRSWEG